MLKLLMSFCIVVSLLTNNLFAADLMPPACSGLDTGCRCFPPEDISKIAGLVKDHRKCEASLLEKDILLQNRFIEFQASGEAWWQEPSVILGGIVVSASLATIVTVLLIKDK